MKDFFKYLTAGDDDKSWGLYLNVAGKSKVAPNSIYPLSDHPTGYYFTWNNGRTLNEYQINYITEGNGFLENSKGKFKVNDHSLMIIRKNDWHRYRPAKGSGWIEHYIGFDGMIAKHLLSDNQVLKGHSVIKCNMHSELIDTYNKIFDLALDEKPGFQQIASGLIVKLLGQIVAQQKEYEFKGKRIEKIIQKTRLYIRENIEHDIDLEKLAFDNNVGYSYFRKMFKQYTGISPRQYHLELKLIRAKELILSSNKSLKEICFEMGFQSVHYFSRYFKKKMGVNPSELRKVKSK